MKLAIDGDVFAWQQRGGISRIYANLIPRWARLEDGSDVRLAVPAWACQSLPGALMPYVTRVPQISPRARPWRVWNRIAPSINGILSNAFWRRLEADVFLSTYFTTPPVRCPSVCVVYDMIGELFPEVQEASYAAEISARKRRAVEAAAVVVCISEQTRRDVVRLLGVPETKCRVIPLAAGMGPDVVARVDGGPATERPFFLYVGDHVTPYKNFNFVLEALASPLFRRFSDVDLVVVSPYPPGRDLQDQYRVALAAGKIRFLRGCDDAVLSGLYRRCAAFICPSLYEGFGLTVLEALSAGTPVVCSRVASLPEVGGDVAHYFDPRSPSEFLLALERAWEEGRGADAVSRRRAQAARFSWDESARQFVQVFQEVARR